MKRFIKLVILLSCVLQATEPGSNAMAGQSQRDLDASVSNLTREGAISFSDALVENLILDDATVVYAKMERAFRHSVKETDMPALLREVYASYGGRPTAAEFKADQRGYRAYPDGSRKPMRKMWYSVETTEHPKGSHFLFVEVVPDGEHLACSGFSIVTFPKGVPPALQ